MRDCCSKRRERPDQEWRSRPTAISCIVGTASPTRFYTYFRRQLGCRDYWPSGEHTTDQDVAVKANGDIVIVGTATDRGLHGDQVSGTVSIRESE